MIFPYHQYLVEPTPGHPEGVIARPVIPLRISGPTGSQFVMALVDSGSDVTVLPAFVLNIIGSPPLVDARGSFRGVGGQVVNACYANADLALDHADGFFQWQATVGFLDGRDVAILGQAGFLEFFDATFRSAKQQLTLKPNARFSGTIKS